MKSVSAGLAAIISSPAFIQAELYTITLANGTVLRRGDYEPALPVLVAGGNAYPTSGLRFERTQTTQTTGLEVATFDLDIYADPLDASSWINGLPFQAFVAGGGLDGAKFRVDRCFMAVWGDCATNGTMPWFEGKCGVAVAGRTKTTLTVNANTELLNYYLPSDVYQPGCLNTLYDSRCKLDKASHGSGALTVGAGSTLNVINTAYNPGADYYTLGTITFLTGSNAGLIRTIKSQGGAGYGYGQFVVSQPLIVAPIAGDTFAAYPGCDKQLATCISKFANRANYRGQPFVPSPETAQ